MFRLTFLGTSSGIPTRERNVCALAVECIANPKNQAKHHHWLLIDCGEGTQHQLLNTHLSLADLSAILITHTHGDHCYGLAGLLASIGMHGRKEPLTLIAPRAIGKLLDTLSLVSELHFNYPIDFIIIEDALNTPLSFNFAHGHDINIHIHELSHRVPSFGFEIIQTLQKYTLLKDKLSADDIANIHWGRILKADDELPIENKTINPHDYKIHLTKHLKIVIAGDNDTPALLADAVKGCQALIHEATYTDEIMQKIINRPAEQGGFNPKHSSAKMVAQFAKEQHIPQLILTHFSARYALFEDVSAKQANMGHIRDEVERYYGGDCILAKDFMQISIDNDEVKIEHI